MYGRWLSFFHSPLSEIQKKKVKKEWLDDGKMKVEGGNGWTVVLQPEVSRDIYELMYEEKEKKE